MNSSVKHDQWLEAAAAYALDALDAGEREAFEAHLDACGQCRLAVQEYREVTGLLMHASAPAEAPPGLSSRVEQMLAAERGLAAPGQPASTAGPPENRRTRSAEVVPIAPRARSVWRQSAVWLAAAAVAFATFLGVRWREATSERESARLALEDAKRALAERDTLLENLRGPRVHVASLAAPSGGQPTARVFWNHVTNNYVVTAFRLPQAQRGRVYQLWAVVKGRDPVSMGTFNTDGSGSANVIIPVSEQILALGVIDLCALTEEPAGGSRGPTETPRLVGEWRHTD